MYLVDIAFMLIFSLSSASHSRSRLRMNSTGNTADGADVSGPAVAEVVADNGSPENARADGIGVAVGADADSDELFPPIGSN